MNNYEPERAWRMRRWLLPPSVEIAGSVAAADASQGD